MVGIAVVGCGRIGSMHARNVANNARARLVTVFDVNMGAAASVATELGVKPASSVKEILSNSAVQGVLIASSTDTHVDLIMAAVNAGKGVLCEKPIDLDVERARTCWREIADRKPRVMIGFNRRFDLSFRALKQRIQNGEIGKPELLIITSRDPAPPSAEFLRHSGGMFNDFTIHDLDTARYLVGEILEVHACGANLVDPLIGELGDIDTCAVTLRSESGALVQITNSRRSVYGYDQRVEVFGERGMLLADNLRATSVESWTDRHTAAQDTLLRFFIERYRAAYIAELDAFVSAMESGGPMHPDFGDGLAALVLAQAAGRSMASGRTVKLRG
ncbi:MAG: inositol 2-dehydrogenase [Gammaproteobacteria bacterium]|nr:inositol 2-dehydrogenase [Gammaproteobacteria bacterium]